MRLSGFNVNPGTGHKVRCARPHIRCLRCSAAKRLSEVTKEQIEAAKRVFTEEDYLVQAQSSERAEWASKVRYACMTILQYPSTGSATCMRRTLATACKRAHATYCSQACHRVTAPPLLGAHARSACTAGSGMAIPYQLKPSTSAARTAAYGTHHARRYGHCTPPHPAVRSVGPLTGMSPQCTLN